MDDQKRYYYQRLPASALIRICLEAQIRLVPPVQKSWMVERLCELDEKVQINDPEPNKYRLPFETASSIGKRVNARKKELPNLPVCRCGCGNRVQTKEGRFMAGHQFLLQGTIAACLDGKISYYELPEVVQEEIDRLYPGDAFWEMIERPQRPPGMELVFSDAEEIRRLHTYEKVPARELARIYNVAKVTIQKIIEHRRFKEEDYEAHRVYEQQILELRKARAAAESDGGRDQPELQRQDALAPTDPRPESRRDGLPELR